MKTLTIDDALSFGPCWEDARGRMENIATAYNQQEWSAVDILRLPEDVVSNEDKLWLVLREELIDALILHEFACRCAEHALSRIDNPDPRSVAAIEDKRAWLSGDITDEQLQSAQDAAYYAVEAASCDAAYWAAYWATADAVDNFADDDGVIERAWQVDTLIKMLEGGEIKIEDCKTVPEYFGVKCGDYIWVNGVEFKVGENCLRGGEKTTCLVDGLTLVGCLTGQIKWRTEPPKLGTNEDCKTLPEFFGVKYSGSIWIDGAKFTVFNRLIIGDGYTTDKQDGQALVGCLTGQLKWSTEPPKPEPNEDETAILQSVARWLNKCDVISIDKDNDIVATNEDCTVVCFPCGIKESRQSYGYDKLIPILNKYGKIDLKKFRTVGH